MIADAELKEALGHALEAYPDECCGVLIGEIEADRHTVIEVRSAANALPVEQRQSRYLIAPAFVARTMNEARRMNQDIVGYYHSHPDHPACPSETDLELAWPNTSYLILSVSGGILRGAQSWRLAADRSTFEEEQIERLSPTGKETL